MSEEEKEEKTEQTKEKKEDLVSIKDVMKLDLRIAHITAVADHPNADRLLVIHVKVGEEERRIVAGIKKAYTAEELIGKKIVMIVNLEPAVLRGVESQGMLLAASDADDIALLCPEKDIPSGSKVK